MKKIYFKTFINLVLVGLFLAGCTSMGKKKGSKVFKHDTPLIKTDVKQLGKKLDYRIMLIGMNREESI